MSSTSTSKFGMEKKSNAKDSSRRSDDFTSFTSSLNTDLDSLPLKAGVGKSDPLFIANKVNNILISGGTKYRVPITRSLHIEDTTELIECLVRDLSHANKTIEALGSNNESSLVEHTTEKKNLQSRIEQLEI